MENNRKGRFAMRAEVRSTDDLQAIRRLCLESGLEDGNFDNILSAVGCYKGLELVGCAVLKKEGAIYSIDWVAVHESVRRMGIGSMLVHYVESEARTRGASSIWTLARTPAFFSQLGYSPSQPSSGSPNIEHCLGCKQYNNGCRPEILSKRL